MSDEIVKEFISENSHFKVTVVRRQGGLFEVLTYKWTHEIIPGIGEVAEPFWEPVSSTTITDNLTNAEKLANEELLAWSRKG